MDTNDYGKYHLPIYQVSTTNNEDNGETEDQIKTDKPSPSDAAKNGIDLISTIAAVPMVMKIALAFPSSEVPDS